MAAQQEIWKHVQLGNGIGWVNLHRLQVGYWQVQVWVDLLVPGQNPYPNHGFCGYQLVGLENGLSESVIPKFSWNLEMEDYCIILRLLCTKLLLSLLHGLFLSIMCMMMCWCGINVHFNSVHVTCMVYVNYVSVTPSMHSRLVDIVYSSCTALLWTQLMRMMQWPSKRSGIEGGKAARGARPCLWCLGLDQHWVLPCQHHGIAGYFATPPVYA